MTLIQKTYCCRLDSLNVGKERALEELLSSVSSLSSCVFENRIPFDALDGSFFYKGCREAFPLLNSKLVQKVIQRYGDLKDIFSLKEPIDCSLLFDNQMFDISFSKEGSYFDAFLRICSTKKGKRMNIPLSGLWPIKKLKEAKKIDQVEIIKHKTSGSFYAHIVASFECAPPIEKTKKSVGIDLNHKNIALSNNTFESMKELVHHKDEARKGRSAAKNAAPFTKNFIHKLTSKIIRDLRNDGTEVLFLEDLSGLRRRSSRKIQGTSKGKKLNHRSNSFPFSMIRSFLCYKALEVGMKVIAKKEQTYDSSKECSKCSSKETHRLDRHTFFCFSCGLILHADLNGARNIEKKGRALLNAEMSDTPLQTPEKSSAEVSLF